MSNQNVREVMLWDNNCLPVCPTAIDVTPKTCQGSNVIVLYHHTGFRIRGRHGKEKGAEAEVDAVAGEG